MWSSSIGPFVYSPIYFSYNSSCSKVHLDLDVILYGFFGHPLLSMNTSSTCQCLTSGYKAWCWIGDRTISLPFDTRRITNMNILFGNSGRLLLAFLLMHTPESIAGCLLPCHPSFLAIRILLAHFCENISTHCWWIHSAISKLSNGSQLSNVSKNSATTVA